MINIIYFLFALLPIGAVAFALKMLKKHTIQTEYSKHITGELSPDNNAPTIEEMIAYHKQNASVKYIIDK